MERLPEDHANARRLADGLAGAPHIRITPAEVDTLLGDSSKALVELGWLPEIGASELCAEMMAADLAAAQQQALLKSLGYPAQIPVEA